SEVVMLRARRAAGPVIGWPPARVTGVTLDAEGAEAHSCGADGAAGASPLPGGWPAVTGLRPANPASKRARHSASTDDGSARYSSKRAAPQREVSRVRATSAA